MNLFQRMAAITEEISTVAKNLEVGFGNNKYKAVSEADVLRAVKPIEKKHGVYSYPFNREVIETDIMTSINSKGNEVQSKFMRVATTYRFVNVDEPSEFIDIKTYGDGVDTQDKAPGKAMTYADKYALLKAYKIQTGEDPDAKASEEGRFANTGLCSDRDKKRIWAMLKNRFGSNEEIMAFMKSKGVTYDGMTQEQYVLLAKELA